MIVRYEYCSLGLCNLNEDCPDEYKSLYCEKSVFLVCSCQMLLITVLLLLITKEQKDME